MSGKRLNSAIPTPLPIAEKRTSLADARAAVMLDDPTVRFCEHDRGKPTFVNGSKPSRFGPHLKLIVCSWQAPKNGRARCRSVLITILLGFMRAITTRPIGLLPDGQERLPDC